jgi:hypothetical protein
VLLEARPDGMITIAQDKLPAPGAQWRRSVYLLSRRAYHLSFLTVFDQPVLATNCLRRDASAVPLQALAMANGELVLEQAEHLAARVVQRAGSAEADQIKELFRLTLSRRPTEAEAAQCARFLELQVQTYAGLGTPPDEAAGKALTQLCHTVLNTSEFLYTP